LDNNYKKIVLAIVTRKEKETQRSINTLQEHSYMNGVVDILDLFLDICKSP
jgi:hypothetical protein